MPEKEYEPLIDRKSHVEHVNEHFSDALWLLKDMVNYGRNLIPRCFVSSNRELSDVIILPVLLRQVVAMLDAIEVLVSNAAVTPANLQGRALFEASLYIDWILQGDSEKKARYYYVWNVRSHLEAALRQTAGTSESTRFQEKMAAFGPEFAERITASSDELAGHIEDINSVLAQPDFQPINDNFESCKGNREFDPAWYVPLGIRSVRKLAEALEREHEYEVFYTRASQTMHSSAYATHVRFGKEALHFTPIRYLKDINIVLNFSVATVLATYKKVIEHYRPGELPALRRKYAQAWREPFRSIRRVQYRADEEVII